MSCYLALFRPTTLFPPTRELAVMSLRCRFPALLTDTSRTNQPGCGMDCTVGLFRHRATLLSQIAVCQVISTAFPAAASFSSPIRKMILVFGGGLLSSAGGDAPGADQLGL